MRLAMVWVSWVVSSRHVGMVVQIVPGILLSTPTGPAFGCSKALQAFSSAPRRLARRPELASKERQCAKSACRAGRTRTETVTLVGGRQ